MSRPQPQDRNQVLPVIAKVDVVIVGATSGAVALALAARRKGLKVYVLSERPYLGEDICGAYRFWPETVEGTELSKAIFRREEPPTPMHVKLTLEQRLVGADIPFLFNSFPVGVLRSEGGRIGGLAIANRAGLQSVRARAVVDASLNGTLLQQSGYTKLHRFYGVQRVGFVTLCEGSGRDASGAVAVDPLPGYAHEEYTLSARRYHLDLDFGQGSASELANAYSEAVDHCWVPEEYRHQTRLTPLLPEPQEHVCLDQLKVEAGLYGLTEAMRLPGGAEAWFCNPHAAMHIAESMARHLSNHLSPLISGTVFMDCAGSEPVACGDVRLPPESSRTELTQGSEVYCDLSHLPYMGRVDVLVVGGGTGGAPAAIAAQRAGADTLVVELTSGLGGVGTMGQISKYWFGNRVGFTEEIDHGVRDLEYREEFQHAEGRWSVTAKSAWYHQTGREAGCTYWFQTLSAGVCVKEGRVSGVLVAGPFGFGIVEAGCVVDSTGCSDIPAAAGAPVQIVGKEHIAVQGTGLAGMKPGVNYRNSDHTFSDDTDITDATAILTSAKLKFRDDFDCGELVDSRERRQIIGDLTMSPVDILYERRFPDTICVATSNFDSHGFTVDPVFMLMPADKKVSLWADIPLRCLLPQGLEGVLVTGLGLSAHRDALPVIRMQADVQNQGYAAGWIAALSARRGQKIRDLDIREIQAHLVQVGNVPKRVLDEVDSFPVDDWMVRQAVAEGWDSLSGIALILHETERSLPYLREAYESVAGAQTKQSIRYGEMLSLLGDSSAQHELLEALEAREWDAGWRFRGMGQFGMTLSEVDTLLICVGQIGDESAWPAILEKLVALPLDAELSHFRAGAMACEAMFPRHPNTAAADVLNQLLQRPGYRGHAQTDIGQVQAALTEDINENEVRDRALRELHLARALYYCGDPDGVGRSILKSYGNDSRGHFARHANAVLKVKLGQIACAAV